MHELRVPLCIAALLLAAPALAHPAKNKTDHSEPQAMKCSDMHSAMQDHMKGDAKHAPKAAGAQPGMMEGADMSAMKCMHEDKPKAPPANGEAQAPHDHNHPDAQPPK